MGDRRGGRRRRRATSTPGDRVVVPFHDRLRPTAACADAGLCSRNARPTPGHASRASGAQRSSATPSSDGRGARRAGRVPARARRPQYTPIKVPEDPRPTSASCSSPTSCRPPGRRSSTPTSPTGGTRRGARPRPGRATWSAPDRAASRAHRVVGVDLVPERLALRAHARRRGHRPARLRRRPRDVHPRADRRPRTGLGDRRRRHGGARLARRQGPRTT